MEIQIRTATAADYQAFCALCDDLDAQHREALPHLFQKPEGPVRERDYFEGLLADEQVGLFLAETGGNPVGFVHVIVRDTPPIPLLVPQRIAVVDGIAVTPAFQQHGIGRRLMEAAQAWAQAQGATAMELSVYEFNAAAIAFYQELGYQTVSRRMRKGF